MMRTRSAIQQRLLKLVSGTSDGLPVIGQHALESILRDAPRPLDLASQLGENGFSPSLTAIDFSQFDPALLDDVQLKNISLVDCSFKNQTLRRWTIEGCRLQRVVMDGAIFTELRLQHSRLDHCTFFDTSFAHARLDQVQIVRSSLGEVSFEGANLQRTTFTHCSLPATHFFDVEAQHSAMRHCNLTDTLLCDANIELDLASSRTQRQTRPAVTTLVSDTRGISVPLVGRKLADVGNSIPLRIMMRHAEAKPQKIDEEVASLIAVLNAGAGAGALGAAAAASAAAADKSLARRIVEALMAQPDTYPNAAAIVRRASRIVSHTSGTVLPGGEDVSPALYGEASHAATAWSGDYQRSLLELGLIHFSRQSSLPLMAICRGFQMTCIYYGAKLIQHIGSGQVGVQVLEWKNRHVLAADPAHDEPVGSHYGNRFGSFRAAVYHHQAVSLQDLANTTGSLKATVIHPVVDDLTGEVWQIPMVVENMSIAAPIIGLQFHPEFFASAQGQSGSARERAGAAAVPSNDDLVALARSYRAAGSANPGLRTPQDMVNSGILNHMSSENDEFWKMHGLSASARWRSRELVDALQRKGTPLQMRRFQLAGGL
ncbi:MAG: gamma-glutamyl-gamma-aminobutyrate hydrolase family protein [Janthinobacterium lividum]